MIKNFLEPHDQYDPDEILRDPIPEESSEEPEWIPLDEEYD